MERMMIGSLQLNSTTTGKQVIDLFSNDTRLQYPVLRLFDLSELTNIGLDPNQLQPGQTLHRRFWAYYVQSDKKNQRGSHYKDVQYLEPYSSSAAEAGSTEQSEELPSNNAGACAPDVVAELRRIRIHLEAILRELSNGSALRASCELAASEARQSSAATQRGNLSKPKTTAAAAQSISICPTCSTHPCLCDELADPVRAVREPPPDDPTLRYADGTEVSDDDPEIQAYTAYLTAEHKPPPDVDALRAWVLDTAKPRR